MKVAGMNFRLSSFAEPVTPASASDATLRNEISRLLSFNRMRGQLAYYLPEYARIIDPEGVMVPDLVVAEMHRAATHGVRDVVSWSRFAEDYPKNSEPWRRIASAASIIAATLDTEGKNHIYHHLEDSSRSSSHPAGEMNPQPGQELEQCQRELDEETDRTLLEYRRWDRDRAQAIYNHTVAQFEEEQGNHS